MSLYSQKQRWKFALLTSAVLIVVASLWYSNLIVTNVREDEHRKVELWSQAIEQRALLVNYTTTLFNSLRNEESKRMDTWAKATARVSLASGDELTFLLDIITKNTTIPVIIADDQGRIISSANLPKGDSTSTEERNLEFELMKKQFPPIEIEIYKGFNQYLYYRDSRIITELKSVLNDIINSFINETVINAASVPVILTDSTLTNVLSHSDIPEEILADSILLQNQIVSMGAQNKPISVSLDGKTHFIYYEDSIILKQLKYYPIVQFVIIGLFLFIAYLLFSTFRKAEQNQVWVGLAKETAHQLGTPLSSLMAWVALLEARGADQDMVDELQKDVNRLEIITDRFSKIGSKPELHQENVEEVIIQTIDYLRPRTSSRLVFDIICNRTMPITAQINVPLFSWVIENLCKNSIDAMNGEGQITIEITNEIQNVYVDVSDTGKGISKANQKAVFKPGYTTKKRGWGLGLSLSKRIVENYHGGKIFVKRSEINKGTTFRIVLRK
jgi:hypothetical protein